MIVGKARLVVVGIIAKLGSISVAESLKLGASSSKRDIKPSAISS
jgi:hypothetical protein